MEEFVKKVAADMKARGWQGIIAIKDEDGEITVGGAACNRQEAISLAATLINVACEDIKDANALNAGSIVLAALAAEAALKETRNVKKAQQRIRQLMSEVSAELPGLAKKMGIKK